MRESLFEALQAMRAAGHAPEPRLVVRLGDGRLHFYPVEAVERLEALRNERGPFEAYVVDAEGMRQAEACSRNSAIFAASLGMTTGALPKVEVSSSPAGVSSAPVW